MLSVWRWWWELTWMAIKCNEKNLTVKCGWTFASRRTNSGKQRSWVFFAQNVGERNRSRCCYVNVTVCLVPSLFFEWPVFLHVCSNSFSRSFLAMPVGHGILSMARKGREHRPLSTPKLLLGEKPTAKWNGIRRNRQEIPHLLLCFRMLLLYYVCSNRGFFCIDSIGLPLVNARFDCEAQRKRLNNIRVAHVVLQKYSSVTYDRTLVDRWGTGKRGQVPEKENKVRKKRFQGKILLQKS